MPGTDAALQLSVTTIGGPPRLQVSSVLIRNAHMRNGKKLGNDGLDLSGILSQRQDKETGKALSRSSQFGS